MRQLVVKLYVNLHYNYRCSWWLAAVLTQVVGGGCAYGTVEYALADLNKWRGPLRIAKQLAPDELISGFSREAFDSARDMVVTSRNNVMHHARIE